MLFLVSRPLTGGRLSPGAAARFGKRALQEPRRVRTRALQALTREAKYSVTTRYK